jgi:hypothetical protein
MHIRSLLGLAALCSAVASDARALQQRPPEACDAYHAAVRANPNDVAAAIRFGSCSVEDEEMVAVGGDSSRLVFRSSWAPALRALRRAVQLDPKQSAAYQPLFSILLNESRDGCSVATGLCEFVAPVRR